MAALVEGVVSSDFVLEKRQEPIHATRDDERTSPISAGAIWSFFPEKCPRPAEVYFSPHHVVGMIHEGDVKPAEQARRQGLINFSRGLSMTKQRVNHGKETTMSENNDSSHERWARVRFAIIGSLLAAPPRRQELQAQLKQLAEKQWKHPITEESVRFGVSTIERWYYKARKDSDPVRVLRRCIRKDAGTCPSLQPPLRQALQAQYKDHPRWSYQLHTDNLKARVELKEEEGGIPSYATIRRYMVAQGLKKQAYRSGRSTPGGQQAALRFEQREVRSYEMTHVHGLWHLDFHVGSLAVLTPQGEWVKPHLLAIMDDYSRVVCHAQWYLDETTEALVHGFSQALQKRGLPRALMSDNGSAMTAEEFVQGLMDLSILHETTLPYSPYQNGKQEVFWGSVEGRLLAMLENCPNLTLKLLNEATQAWVELEYNHKRHDELGMPPLQRYLEGPTVGRECPGSDILRQCFRIKTQRIQRKSDGTIKVEGQRFELPGRFRHLDRISIRYARWDLSRVDLVDERTGTILCSLYPLNKAENADGLRRHRETSSTQGTEPKDTPKPEIAPLLRQLMADYAATGLPPAYLPKEERDRRESDNNESDKTNHKKSNDKEPHHE